MKDVSETRYSVVYVKRDGTWLIDRVTEDDIVTEAIALRATERLEWMIGEWSDAGEEFVIDTAASWTKAKTSSAALTPFLTRKTRVVGTANHRLGSQGEQIRSWLFDSDGGLVAGTWTQRDDQWVVQSVATLAGGGSGSFTSIFRPLDDGKCAWQKFNRVIDGKLLPNIDEIVVQRK